REGGGKNSAPRARNMSLDKLFEVAGKRTQGEWRAHNKNALNEWLVYGPERQLYFIDGVTKCASDEPKPYPLESTEANAKVISLVSNCWPEIEAVLKAVEGARSVDHNFQCIIHTSKVACSCG